MTKKEILDLHEDVSNKARALMTKKNHDYATDADPLRNFRDFGRLGVVVRLYDKLARLRSFEEQGELHVADETILDTIEDGINYLIIYYAMYCENSQPKPA